MVARVRYAYRAVEDVENEARASFEPPAVRRVVVFGYAGRRFGVPVEHTREVMRPGTIDPVPDLPVFVRGVTLVRGQATPVIDLGELLGEPGLARTERLLHLRTENDRGVALLVEHVVGVHAVPRGELPPLLAHAPRGLVQDLARLDGHLLTVLRTAALVPEDVWTKLRREERA